MKVTICISCLKEFKYSPRQSKGLYCSNKCQQLTQRDWYIMKWLRGFEKGWNGKTKNLSHHIVSYLREVRGTACEKCGWDERHPVDNAILTEIDHIDGNAENCRPVNLRILCPNCHSMTPTFRARNKASKRNRS